MPPHNDTLAQTVSGFRRIVTLLALAAWMGSALACPVPHDAVDTGHSQAVHSHDEGQAPHPDSDECCRVLGQTHAIVQGLATPPSFKATAPSFLIAVAATPLMAAADAPVAELIPVSNGPPRSRYLRFATFWSHAPPTDRV